MFEKMKLYVPVKITGSEVAEACPVGTVAVGYAPWDTIQEFPISEVKRGVNDWSGEYPDYRSWDKEMIGWTAMIESSYKEVIGDFASYLEGGTQWMDDTPTEEELDLITTIRTIRDHIDYEN